MTLPHRPPPLEVRRHHRDPDLARDGERDRDPGRVLGRLGYGEAAGAESDADGIALRLLGDAAGPVVDAWCGGAVIGEGESGLVRWRHDGHWLWGALEVPEDGRGVAAQAHRAYAGVFEALAATGFTQLQRLWNYLPRINADGGGLERYRQFNAGRREAFLEAGQAASEGAPAACAIGTRSGALALRFLAGRSAPLPVENPRQVSAYHYPQAYGPASPSFSRAALVDAGGGRTGLLVSGTASIVGYESRHPGDVAAQAHETLANLRAVVDAAHVRTAARFDLGEMDLVVYLRRGDDLDAVRTILEAAVGASSAAARGAIYAEADICRNDLLVEIEAHGFALGESSR